MLHISHNVNPKRFIPVIGHRQAHSEDRTVPRICVSTCLVGTILGHSAFENMAQDSDFNKKDMHGVAYKGGLKIYKFEYEIAVRPNAELVYDSDVSDEHWLITYNKDTVTYKPIEIGELFIKRIVFDFSDKGKREAEVVYYVKVNEEIEFGFEKPLKPGCYKVVSPASMTLQSYKDTENIRIVKLPEEEYFKMKSETASLLSMPVFPAPIPRFSNWQ